MQNFKKLNPVLWIFGFCIVSGFIGCASKSDQEEEKERMYSPVCLYLNPLKYGDNIAYSEYFPLFANYPTDWAKCGLKAYPMEVSYEHYDVVWHTRYAENGWFNKRGQLVSTRNTGWGKGNDNTYDEKGRLVEILRYYPSNGHKYRVPVPEYQDSLISSWKRFENVGYMEHNYILNGIEGYYYSYYPNGTLRSLVPKFDSQFGQRSELGKMEFNDIGQLVKMEAPFTANPFLSDIDPNLFDITAVSNFYYDDRGLCGTKTEDFIMSGNKGGERACDTIMSINHYKYNEQGDMIEWSYYGGIKSAKHANVFYVDRIKIDIHYDYKYDSKGNWTEMLVELPKDFHENYVLAEYYERVKKNSPFQWDSEDYDGDRMIVFHRSIDGYYENSLNESMVAKEEKETDEEQSNKPKYTGAMAQGLQGPVKMVKNEAEKQTTVFNKIGNIESFISANGYRDCNNTYIYETPTRYRNGDIRYRIDINGNVMRMICEPDEEIFEFEDEYEFDDKGRVIKHTWYDGMMGVSREFAYQGDNRLPYKETQSSQDEQGDWSTTIEYKYVDVDKHGNWTKRIGTTHSVTNDYVDVQDEDGNWDYNGGTNTTESTDTVEEVRTITYY